MSNSALSYCCDAVPRNEMDSIEDGICSKCGEHSEFYFEDGCYKCGGDLKKNRFGIFVCEDCGEPDEDGC